MARSVRRIDRPTKQPSPERFCRSVSHGSGTPDPKSQNGSSYPRRLINKAASINHFIQLLGFTVILHSNREFDLTVRQRASIHRSKLVFSKNLAIFSIADPTDPTTLRSNGRLSNEKIDMYETSFRCYRIISISLTISIVRKFLSEN